MFEQMAKHVGLIPSLDGGLYQVNGDKVEVQINEYVLEFYGQQGCYTKHNLNLFKYM